MSAKPASWYLNAARRTVSAAVPALARPDDAWAEERLEPAEAALYLRLPAPERVHAIDVARCVLRKRPDAPAVLVRAALLHDVGKLGSPHHVVWRVLTHLLPEPKLPAEPRMRGLAGARQARRHHAAYGAEAIRRAGGGEDVADLVQRHHDSIATGDAAILRACDART
ncbi:MAG: HD domain-containing protein [Trueperaceae bacterium]